MSTTTIPESFRQFWAGVEIESVDGSVQPFGRVAAPFQQRFLDAVGPALAWTAGRRRLRATIFGRKFEAFSPLSTRTNRKKRRKQKLDPNAVAMQNISNEKSEHEPQRT